MKEEGRPGESQAHRWMDTQRCSLLLPRGPCVYACMRVHKYMLIIMLLHVIMFWVAVLSTLSVSLHLLTNELSIKHSKEKVFTVAPLTVCKSLCYCW